MIFIDSNIPMYLVGGSHPNKHRARAILERLASERRRLVTDVEVIQEILHRYVAIDRKDAIQPAIDTLRQIVDETISIDEDLVLEAKDLVLAYPKLSARDALHVAVMKAWDIKEILSFDQGFDQVPGIKRIQ